MREKEHETKGTRGNRGEHGVILAWEGEKKKDGKKKREYDGESSCLCGTNRGLNRRINSAIRSEIHVCGGETK